MPGAAICSRRSTDDYYVIPPPQEIDGAVLDALYARLLAEGLARPARTPRCMTTGWPTRTPEPPTWCNPAASRSTRLARHSPVPAQPETRGAKGKGWRRRPFCHVYGRGKGQAQMIPGWPYSVVAALEPGRTSWTALLDAVRLCPDDDETDVTAAQVRGVVERLAAAGHWSEGDPDILIVFDAGSQSPGMGSPSCCQPCGAQSASLSGNSTVLGTTLDAFSELAQWSAGVRRRTPALVAVVTQLVSQENRQVHSDR